jgi:hypothetical protein
MIIWHAISGRARHRLPPRFTSRQYSYHNRSAVTISVTGTVTKADLNRKARNSAQYQSSPLSCFCYNRTLYLERFPHFRRHDLRRDSHLNYSAFLPLRQPAMSAFELTGTNMELEWNTRGFFLRNLTYKCLNAKDKIHIFRTVVDLYFRTFRFRSRLLYLLP